MTVEPLHGSTTALVTHPRSAPELVSVVIPVLNEVSDLPAQLAALADQTYAGPWELIVCDNGSVDGTPELAASWTDRLPDVRVVDASDRKGINHARNVGLEHARGDFVAFCDGDDVVSPDWLDALVAAAPHADIVAGALDMEHLNGAGATRPQPLPAALPVKHRFLPGVPGGNCGVWRAVAVELGWDERFTFGSSDIEFGWRARLAGYRIDYAPRAVVRVRVPAGLQALARQWYRYGASDGRLFRTFRRFGMQRSRVGEAARAWAWILVHVGDLWGPDPTRLQWVRVASLRAGRLIGSVRARTLFL